jgi:hypothetical protein
MNNVALSGALMTAPYDAFTRLRERPRFWFPLLLVVASTGALVFWYYSTVDIEWLKDAMNLQGPRAMVTRSMMLWSSVVAVVIVVPVLYLVQALLLLLTARVTRVPVGFKYWFSMVSWSSLPALLGIVTAAIFLILSDTPQISPGVLQPLSINELLLHRPLGSPGQALLDTLSIPTLLSWVLRIIGVRSWTQRSWLFSATFVLLPTTVIYGIWAILAFR